MKLKLINILFVLSCVFIHAQTVDFQNIKKITVIGSAEMSIVPNKLNFEIELQANSAKGLKNTEKEFLKVLKDNGIKDKQVIFKSQNNWNNWWYYHYYKNYNRKKIILKLTDKTNIKKLLSSLKKDWIYSLKVSKYNHTEIQKYRQDVKKEAIKAAKKKANYLLESIDEEIGSILSIEELQVKSAPNNYWRNPNPINTYSNSNVSLGSNSNTKSSDNMEGVADIKLKYEVKAIFQIK